MSEIANIACVIMPGICSTVKILVNAVAQPKITIVVAVVEHDVPIACNNFFNGNSLWINEPQTKAYKAATAAASVGVKIPA